MVVRNAIALFRQPSNLFREIIECLRTWVRHAPQSDQGNEGFDLSSSRDLRCEAHPDVSLHFRKAMYPHVEDDFEIGKVRRDQPDRRVMLVCFGHPCGEFSGAALRLVNHGLAWRIFNPLATRGG
jgi:hypothetical protein